MFWNKSRENQLEDNEDFENNSAKPINFHFGSYVEIADYIPSELIIRQKSNEDGRDLTIYDLIAKVTGLEYCERNIYQNKKGNYFIRTKYGFQPMTAYNKGLQLRDKNILIKDLESDLVNLQSELLKVKEINESLQEEIEKSKDSIIDPEKLKKNEQKTQNIRNQMEVFRLMYTEKKQEVKALKAENIKLNRMLKAIIKQVNKFGVDF